MLIKFDNGAHGSFTVNQVAARRKNRMYFEIYGSKCSVVFDSEEPNQIWIGHRDGNNEIMMKDPSLMYPNVVEYNSYPGGHTEGFADASKRRSVKIYEAMEAGKDSDVFIQNLKIGYRELALCKAIVKSAARRKMGCGRRVTNWGTKRL